MTIKDKLTPTQFRDTSWSFQTDHNNLIRRANGVPIGKVDVKIFNAAGSQVAIDHIEIELTENEASVLEAKFAARRTAYATATEWTHYPPPEPGE